jgi:hypothetical protein
LTPRPGQVTPGTPTGRRQQTRWASRHQEAAPGPHPDPRTATDETRLAVFDKETRWFIRCDTCPDEPARASLLTIDKNEAKQVAREEGWGLVDDLHRCPRCVIEGRTERAS